MDDSAKLGQAHYAKRGPDRSVDLSGVFLEYIFQCLFVRNKTATFLLSRNPKRPRL